jgi:single-strand DNA-binding protein
MYETYVTVVGTLITRVAKRRLPDGGTVVSFRVASNERRFDRTTESWRDGDTLYVNVTCWRRLADNVHASFVVGDPIIVRGRLYSRSYEKDGRQQTVTELDAVAVGPDLARATAVVSRTKRSEGTSQAAESSASAENGTAPATGASEDDVDPWPLPADGSEGGGESNGFGRTGSGELRLG